jgi:hypothetical protein
MPKLGKRKHIDLSERVHAAICARQDVEKFIGTPTNFIENVLMQRANSVNVEAIVEKHVAALERRLLSELDEIKKWMSLGVSRGEGYVGAKYIGPDADRKTGT